MTYTHKGVKGARLPGWEEVNITRLAKGCGITLQHLRECLAGRRNYTHSVIKRVADELGLTVGQVADRIEQAKVLDQERKRQKFEREAERFRWKNQTTLNG